ncbi:MAG: hypothetical protein H0Z33_12220 [Bacillaceae bacterium]|nr:hypothetical protein [Bacillaceae bacterium]
MKLTLYMDDYLTSMGGVGFWRLFEYGQKTGTIPAESSWVEFEANRMLINSEMLKLLPQLYFSYLLDEYSVAKREKQRLKKQREWGKREKNFPDYVKSVKGSFTTNLDKIKKYFKETNEYQHLVDLQKRLKEIRRFQQYDELVTIEEAFVDILSRPFIDEKLTLNFIKSPSLLQSFFGQPSFLNVSKNKLTLQEQIELMYQDYIKPVEEDLQFKKALKSSNIEEIKDILQNSRRQILKNWGKTIKKRSSEEIETYFENCLYCTFFEEWLATDNFEELTFTPLGLSKKNALNFLWNLDDKQPVPISSWAKLVLFMTPIGVTTYHRRFKGEYKFFHGFVYRHGSPKDQIRSNQDFYDMKQNDSPFERIISRLLEQEKERAKFEKDTSFLFIEFSSDYDSKKTIIESFYMPKYLIQYFTNDTVSNLDKIRDYSFKEEFLRMILLGQDTKSLIFNHLRETIRRQQQSYGDFVAFLERQKIEWLKKGVHNVKKNAKRLYFLYGEGQKLRMKILEKSQSRVEETEGNDSTGKKRIAAIAYRLLNAAKSGDKKQFLDTIFRLHLQANHSVSNLFLNALHEEEMDFTTVSGAFISGLLSEPYESEEMKGEVNNG